MSNVVGPVCHIPPPSTPGTPQPFNTPGIPGPASDLTSAIALVNAMRLALMQLLDQIKQNNTDTGVTNNFITKEDKRSDWVEVNRVVEKVRVANPTDKSQYVDVERINSLTMQHRATGQKWNWRRKR